MCRNSNQKFSQRSGTFMPPNRGAGRDDNASLSYSDCKENCWKDCDCVGFRNYGDTGCTYWSGKDLTFDQDLTVATIGLYRLVSDGTDESSGPSSNKERITLIVTATVIPSVVLLMGLLLYWKMKKKSKQGDEEINEDKNLLEMMFLEENLNQKEHGDDGNNGTSLYIFTYASVLIATNNFSLENKLGEGGFGPVYKGKLLGDREVAVKRLSARSGQGIDEFKNELRLIVKLQHTNLVRLFGCCIHRDEKLLIYEFMPNKSLDFFLFDQTKKSILTWDKRSNIIEGIAQGLLYLHKYSRLKIIHRDLKASNILLDVNMNPKISDFGMARIFTQNAIEANTNRVVGTYGYMAPEYAMDGIFSVKSDVFSFGVLLLELISGRRNNSFYDINGPLNLVEHAWELWKKDSAMEFVDPTLLETCVVNSQYLRCINIALLCVEGFALDRPAMDEVVSMLTNQSIPLSRPKKPGFVTRSNANLKDIKEVKLENAATENGLTITEMKGR